MAFCSGHKWTLLNHLSLLSSCRFNCWTHGNTEISSHEAFFGVQPAPTCDSTSSRFFCPIGIRYLYTTKMDQNGIKWRLETTHGLPTSSLITPTRNLSTQRRTGGPDYASCLSSHDALKNGDPRVVANVCAVVKSERNGCPIPSLT